MQCTGMEKKMCNLQYVIKQVGVDVEVVDIFLYVGWEIREWVKI